MDQCNRHGEIELRVTVLESKIKELENKWQEDFEGYKGHFNKKIDKVETDIAESASLYNSLNLTIVKLDNTVNNLVEKLNSFIGEFESNKKDTKTGIIYPLIVGVIMVVAGVIIGRYIK